MEDRSIKLFGFGMIAVAIICYFSYWALGQKIDYEHIVHEPFFLVPISWISLVGGSIITAVAYSVKR